MRACVASAVSGERHCEVTCKVVKGIHPGTTTMRCCFADQNDTDRIYFQDEHDDNTMSVREMINDILYNTV